MGKKLKFEFDSNKIATTSIYVNLEAISAIIMDEDDVIGDLCLRELIYLRSNSYDLQPGIRVVQMAAKINNSVRIAVELIDKQPMTFPFGNVPYDNENTYPIYDMYGETGIIQIAQDERKDYMQIFYKSNYIDNVFSKSR